MRDLAWPGVLECVGDRRVSSHLAFSWDLGATRSRPRSISEGTRGGRTAAPVPHAMPF